MSELKPDHVKDACRAHTNLTVFAAVVAILEGGCLYGGNQPEAAQIIRIAHRAQQRFLHEHDKAVALAKTEPVR